MHTATFAAAQSSYDFQTTNEGQHFSEIEYFECCQETFIASMESLTSSLATFEKHVPRECRSVSELRDWFNEMALRLQELGENL